MTARWLTVAARLPLWWAAWYTAGLPSPIRAARRAEIVSDTYEHLADATWAGAPGGLARDIVQSLLLGAPDDLRWRAGHVSLTGNLVQSFLASAPLGAVAGYITFHITRSGSAGVAVGLCTAAAGALSLLAVSRSEGSMRTNSRSLESADRAGDWLTGAAAFLYPVLVLVAMLIVGPASSATDPYDETSMIDRASETGRWANGFVVYALAGVCGIVGVLGMSRAIRLRGSVALGTIAPCLFAVGVAAMTVVGNGALGVGLAAALEAGANGDGYLNPDGGGALWVFVLTAVGGLLAGLGLWALAAGAWRTQLLAGWERNVCVAALGIEGVMVALGGGAGVNVNLLLGPIAGIVAFGLLVRGVFLSGDARRVTAATGAPLTPAP